ncbi:MAG: protein kinase [Woeseiaceae bacterium]|nr:protein kinase [Woeseiaceae bacterium]
MSADSKEIRDVLDGSLSDLDDSLGATSDDVKILAELKQGLGRLIADDGDAEHAIRRVLQERLDRGELRNETYELVRTMLDRYVTEDVPTSPDKFASGPSRLPPLDDPEPVEDQYSTTTVLPGDTMTSANADDHVQVGSVLRDRFMLQQRVSGGSMGVVYKALDRRLAEAGSEEPHVAIKVLSPQLARSGPALRALQQEAAKGRCLAHPNIVRFIDLDRDDELYFIVMEWLEGRTLAEILDSPDGKSIKLEQSLEIVRKIGHALEYAHRCGIVHADVKPGNIMVAPDGDVKLFDFGVARVLQTGDGGKPFDPSVLGAMTPAYSSMQVLTGEEPTPSDDVFSLGCLLYRLAAGYRVFGPRNAAEAAEEGMTPQRIEALSDAQWAALKKALAFARVARFDNVTEFLDALQRTDDEAISIDIDDAHVPHASEGGRRGLWAALAVLLVGGAAASWYLDLARPVQDWLAGQGLSPADPVFTDAVPDAAPVDSDAPVETQVDMSGGPGHSVADEVTDPDAEPGLDDETLIDPVVAEDAVVPIDFSGLPAADVDVSLVPTPNDSSPVFVTLREDAGAVVVDLLRTDSLAVPLRLRIEEVAFSGNRSPWSAGQYSILEGNVIDIPAGQDRARITLDMLSDPLREADQQSRLRVRPAENTQSQLAAIEVILEDDDQREFESRLPANTVAFAVSQVAVRESDPVVQVDVLRFNPDDQPVVVGYQVRDVTATEGEDYFAPGGYSLSFGPGQRSSRLLIPLVQDTEVEGDEAFTVELAVQDESAAKDVFQRMVIMIRDDEIAIE